MSEDTDCNPSSSQHTNIGNRTVCTEFNQKMTEWRDRFILDVNDEDYGLNVNQWTEFSATAIDLLPGPKHPARKYYQYRKNKSNTDNQKKYKQTTNPERATKRDRLKRREKYVSIYTIPLLQPTEESSEVCPTF
ncbi:hypothetical protein ANN_00824 [Periplaneta americana]|uniref:Uncharacterized protein n=1 Tax=Periplaneta americana TaxID=6978 RepID=A0ABQ8TRY4_PERAM|nr:hypothetical protein ANN_00824 [Periplaneta americana]